MPTYEYRCDSCGHPFELFQLITAKPQKRCPACGRPTARRLISAGAGIIFKGSGFYETDYRSESYKKAAKAEAEAASGDGKGAKAKAKAKDATKDRRPGESSSAKPAD